MSVLKYNPENALRYIELGKKHVKPYRHSWLVEIGKVMLRNEAAVVAFTKDINVPLLKNYLLISHQFKALVWDSPYFWYYFAKHNKLLSEDDDDPVPEMNINLMKEYRKISLDEIYPRCTYTMHMFYVGDLEIDNTDEEFVVQHEEGNSIMVDISDAFIEKIDKLKVVRSVPFVKKYPANDIWMETDIIFRYDGKGKGDVVATFTGADILDSALDNLPSGENVKSRNVTIECYVDYSPPVFDVEVLIPDELEVLRGMIGGKVFTLPCEASVTTKISKTFSDHYWPIVWGVKGEDNFEREQKTLESYMIVVSLLDDADAISEQDSVLYFDSIFQQPFSTIMDKLGEYEWDNHRGYNVLCRVHVVKREVEVMSESE